jgi:hypothetical protein
MPPKSMHIYPNAVKYSEELGKIPPDQILVRFSGTRSDGLHKCLTNHFIFTDGTVYQIGADAKWPGTFKSNFYIAE